MAKRSDYTTNRVVENRPSLPQMTVKFLHYTKLKDNPKQYCDEKSKDEIISLGWKIHADGEVLQPLLVRKVDTDEYEIIAGHKRKRACRYLVEEEGLKQYEFIPCIVKNVSDVRAEFQLYTSNGFHEKTDYEIMHELEQMKRLLEEYPEEFPEISTGRMVDKLAQQLNMKKSTVGEYLQIGKNLSDDAMEKFAAGEITKSAAVALSSLPQQEQNVLVEQGITKHKDIKAYKEEKVEKHVHRTTVTDTVKTVKTHNIEEIVPHQTVEETADIVDVLPGQYRVANTDMELEEVPISDTAPIQESVTNIADKFGKCTCPTCSYPTRIEDTFVFYNKRFCMNCLYKLIVYLADTGVITLDSSSADTKGIIVRS